VLLEKLSFAVHSIYQLNAGYNSQSEVWSYVTNVQWAKMVLQLFNSDGLYAVLDPIQTNVDVIP